MEARLKADVLREAAQYGAAIMVAHENDDFQVVEQWEAVTEVDVQTPLEARPALAVGAPTREPGPVLNLHDGTDCVVFPRWAVCMMVNQSPALFISAVYAHLPCTSQMCCSSQSSANVVTHACCFELHGRLSWQSCILPLTWSKFERPCLRL